PPRRDRAAHPLRPRRHIWSVPLMADLNGRIDARLDAMMREHVVARIWEHDHTLWKPDPAEITDPDRLGWLPLPADMQPDVTDLEAFAAEVAADGFTTAVLMGMGGSSLAPEVFSRTFGAHEGRLALEVSDSTVPADIIALERHLDFDHTLFIVASKSGTT